MTLHLLEKTFKYCVMIHLKVWIAIRRSSSCVSMWWLELNRLEEKNNQIICWTLPIYISATICLINVGHHKALNA